MFKVFSMKGCECAALFSSIIIKRGDTGLILFGGELSAGGSWWRRRVLLAGLLIGLIGAAPSHAENLLFYGNSFTNGLGSSDSVPNLVRDIATAAGVAQALIHYHFKSKRALFLAMVQRRAHIGNLAWEAALAQLPAPELEGILRAFFAPMQADPRGAAVYLRLMGQLANGTIDDRELLGVLFDPTAALFVEAIRLAEPRLDYEAAGTAYRFAIGILGSLVLGSGRERPLDGKIAPDAVAHAFDEAADFCVAGIPALAVKA